MNLEDLRSDYLNEDITFDELLNAVYSAGYDAGFAESWENYPVEWEAI